MNNLFKVLVMITILMLAGCLAHMRASNIADTLNAQERSSESPYYWEVVDIDLNRAKLEQTIVGDVAPSRLPPQNQKAVLLRIEKLEAENGRSTIPTLKETRTWRSLQGLATNTFDENWVFDNNGQEVVYTVEYTANNSNAKEVIRGPFIRKTEP